MKIVAPKESAKYECRVALSPEVSKKLIDLGHTIFIEKGAGSAAGIPDDRYEAAGAKIAKDSKSLYDSADIVIRVNPPTPAEMTSLPKGCILVGMLKPHGNEIVLVCTCFKKSFAFMLHLSRKSFFVNKCSRKCPGQKKQRTLADGEGGGTAGK